MAMRRYHPGGSVVPIGIDRPREVDEFSGLDIVKAGIEASNQTVLAKQLGLTRIPERVTSSSEKIRLLHGSPDQQAERRCKEPDCRGR